MRSSVGTLLIPVSLQGNPVVQRYTDARSDETCTGAMSTKLGSRAPNARVPRISRDEWAIAAILPSRMFSVVWRLLHRDYFFLRFGI